MRPERAQFLLYVAWVGLSLICTVCFLYSVMLPYRITKMQDLLNLIATWTALASGTFSIVMCVIILAKANNSQLLHGRRLWSISLLLANVVILFCLYGGLGGQEHAVMGFR